jgi:hypothetical protein
MNGMIRAFEKLDPATKIWITFLFLLSSLPTRSFGGQTAPLPGNPDRSQMPEHVYDPKLKRRSVPQHPAAPETDDLNTIATTLDYESFLKPVRTPEQALRPQPLLEGSRPP